MSVKVVHLFWGLNYGGIETMLVNIANYQAQYGASVSVVIINNLVSPELLSKFKKEVRLVRINREVGSKNIQFVKKLNSCLNEIKPEIIHLHGAVLVNYINSKWRRNAKIVSTLHAMPTGTVGSPWRWVNIFGNLVLGHGGNIRAIDRVEHVCAISYAVSQALLNKTGIKSDVICNGIETQNFNCRTKWALGNEVKIVQVGRLEYKNKGQDLLLHACSNLIKKGIKLHVDFIGNGTSANFLKQLSNELGISHFVRFLGFQTQEYLCHHLCDYDLFVQPSRYEGFGLTVAEAMSAKVPVIVSSGQGPAEVTENERFGWVFDNGEIQSLSSTILDVIMNYDYAHDKAEKAYQHVLRNYDVSVTALSYLNMYKKLLNRG